MDLTLSPSYKVLLRFNGSLVNGVGYCGWAVFETIPLVLSDVAESLTHGMIILRSWGDEL